MVGSNVGVLSRIMAAFRRWLKADDGFVALRDLQVDPMTSPFTPKNGGASAEPATAAPAPQAPRTRVATDFALPARLHSVAKLNPRKGKSAKTRRPKRAGKPVAAQTTAVKTRRETRHVWLRTRPSATTRPRLGSVVIALPLAQPRAIAAATHRRAA